MADEASNAAKRNRRLTWLVWRQRIADNLLAATLLVGILGVLGVYVAESRETVTQHGGTIAGLHQVESENGPPTRRITVRLDSGAIVPVRRVPEFRRGARIVVEETVSNIFRIRRYTFVSFEDP